MNVPDNKVQWHLTNETTRWHVFKINENFMVIFVNKNNTNMLLLYFTLVDIGIQKGVAYKDVHLKTEREFKYTTNLNILS